jgi:4-oxalocrotonate tautomerase
MHPGQPVASLLRREDVFISLVGTGREDWSFGNGEPSLIKS